MNPKLLLTNLVGSASAPDLQTSKKNRSESAPDPPKNADIRSGSAPDSLRAHLCFPSVQQARLPAFSLQYLFNYLAPSGKTVHTIIK